MKNRKDIILNMYFVEKLRPVDIAKKLDISKSAVTQVLKKDKRYGVLNSLGEKLTDIEYKKVKLERNELLLLKNKQWENI